MPTDLPVTADLAGSALALFHAESQAIAAGPGASIRQSMLAAAVAAVPGSYTIKKGENLGKRKGVTSSAKSYTFSLPAGAIANASATCFQFNIDTTGVTGTMDPKWNMGNEVSISFISDTVGTFDPKVSCLMMKTTPNVNWKPGTKPVTISMTINKPFLEAVRAAAPGDVTFKMAINGYVAPPEGSSSSSSDEDK